MPGEIDTLDLDAVAAAAAPGLIVQVLAAYGFDNSGENPHGWRCKWHADTAAQGKGEPSCTCPQDVAEALVKAGWRSPEQWDIETRRYDDEVKAYDGTLRRQGELLDGVADALKGKAPALTSHSFHDLPQVARETARLAKQKAVLGKSDVAWQEGYVAALRWSMSQTVGGIKDALRSAVTRLKQLEKEASR